MEDDLDIMTLQQFRYIITVAEEGTLSEAAKHLYITQPALTIAIRELEEELGITIFNRTNRGMSLSSEGDEFLGYVRQVMEKLDLIREQYLSDHVGNY